MDNIERFMNHKIGLDVLSSNAQDVDDLSRNIDWFYANKINYKEMKEMGYDSLYGYWQHCINDGWTVCVFEPNYKGFNAFRNHTAKSFRESYDVLTADEILKGCVNYEIEENEVMNLFEVKQNV